VYRSLYLKPDSLAAVPPKWVCKCYRIFPQLVWSGLNLNVDMTLWLQACCTLVTHPQEEIDIDGYRVDGVDHGSKIIFEFYGCFYHGCFKCFPERNKKNKQTGFSFGTLHGRTMEREAFLKSKGWSVVSIWECEWKKMKKENHEIEEFVKDNYFELSPMDPFQSFSSVTVETFKMFVKDKKKRMSYQDVTSLYPHKCNQRVPCRSP